MKKVVFHSAHRELNNNNFLFKNENTTIGDDLLKPFVVLKKKAEGLGIQIGTSDAISINDADIVAFIDYPDQEDEVFIYVKKNKTPHYLITLESPIINPEIFITELHNSFKKIFTWSDELISANSAKYVKLNHSYDIGEDLFSIDQIRTKKCVLIAGNKVSSSGKELYSERLRCINWFNKRSPGNLDLYGLNWNIHIFADTYFLGRLLNRVNRRLKLFRKSFRIYRGGVNRKSDILPMYQFSICLENVCGFDGYITEKIWDCLISGTIPIYKGAGNITKYIPASCFLSYDSFSSLQELDNYFNTVSPEEVRQLQCNILDFLKSRSYSEFTIDFFCKTLLAEFSNG